MCVKYTSAESQLSIIKLSIDVHKVEAQNIGQRVERNTTTKTNKHTHAHMHERNVLLSFLLLNTLHHKMSFMLCAVIAINVIVIVILTIYF